MLSADCVNSEGFKDLNEDWKGFTQIFCLEICADSLSKRVHDWPGLIFGSNVALSINKTLDEEWKYESRGSRRGREEMWG